MRITLFKTRYVFTAPHGKSSSELSDSELKEHIRVKRIISPSAVKVKRSENSIARKEYQYG